MANEELKKAEPLTEENLSDISGGAKRAASHYTVTCKKCGFVDYPSVLMTHRCRNCFGTDLLITQNW